MGYIFCVPSDDRNYAPDVCHCMIQGVQLKILLILEKV